MAKKQQHLQAGSPRSLLVLLLLFPLYTFAGSNSDAKVGDRWYSVRWDNDAVSDDDGGYSNGLYISVAEQLGDNSEALPLKSNHWLPEALLQQRHFNSRYQINHLIYTPSDIKTKPLIEDDRPYAGLMLWSMQLQAVDDYRNSLPQADSLQLTLGVVGPLSGAEQLQTTVHDIRGANEPMGWDHQLENEALIQLSMQRLWRSYASAIAGMEFDIVTAGLAAVGNFRSELQGGATFRFGRGLGNSYFQQQLNNDNSPAPSSHDNQQHYYLFLRASGGYVVNDIRVDGNSFRSSHSRPLEHWQGQLSLGVAVELKSWVFMLSLQENNQAFEGQREDSLYASLGVSWKH